jgi:arylsulfatase A-like enzyme
LKRQTHEGGIRVPFIAYWKGKIPSGRVNETPIAFWDILPTFCDILGDENYPNNYLNPNKKDDCFDGISFKNTLLGNDENQEKHDFLYWEFNETNQIAVRQGDWKLIVKNGVCHLYNLSLDLHEDNDVANQYPNIVEKLKQIVYEQHSPSPHFNVTLP